MSQSIDRGREGEQLAREYLTAQGYLIEETNWRCRWGEIDIVALSPDGILVFVEVKSGYSRRFGHPCEWVTPKKAEKLIKSARQYMLERNICDVPVRFDVIAVDFGSGRITHITDAIMVEE